MPCNTLQFSPKPCCAIHCNYVQSSFVKYSTSESKAMSCNTLQFSPKQFCATQSKVHESMKEFTCSSKLCSELYRAIVCKNSAVQYTMIQGNTMCISVQLSPTKMSVLHSVQYSAMLKSKDMGSSAEQSSAHSLSFSPPPPLAKCGKGEVFISLLC